MNRLMKFVSDTFGSRRATDRLLSPGVEPLEGRQLFSLSAGTMLFDAPQPARQRTAHPHVEAKAAISLGSASTRQATSVATPLLALPFPFPIVPVTVASITGNFDYRGSSFSKYNHFDWMKSDHTLSTIADKIDRATLSSVGLGFAAVGAPDANRLMTHFLAGSGTDVIFTYLGTASFGQLVSSDLAEEAAATSQWKTISKGLRERVLGLVKGLSANAGSISVHLKLYPATDQIGFGNLSGVVRGAGRNLFLSLGGTQGLDVKATFIVGESGGKKTYSGAISYTILDTYGFGDNDTLPFGQTGRELQLHGSAAPFSVQVIMPPDTLSGSM